MELVNVLKYLYLFQNNIRLLTNTLYKQKWNSNNNDDDNKRQAKKIRGKRKIGVVGIEPPECN